MGFDLVCGMDSVGDESQITDDYRDKGSGGIEGLESLFDEGVEVGFGAPDNVDCGRGGVFGQGYEGRPTDTCCTTEESCC